MGGLLRDRDKLRDFTYRLYHDHYCSPFRCSCDPLRRRFRMYILNIFLRISEAARDGLDNSFFRSCGPSPIKSARLRRPRHPGGRPTKYSPVLVVRLGLLITVGGHTIESALPVCGVSCRSLKRWRKSHELLDELLYALEESRKAFPRHYRELVLSPRKQHAARARRERYVKQKATQY